MVDPPQDQQRRTQCWVLMYEERNEALRTLIKLFGRVVFGSHFQAPRDQTAGSNLRWTSLELRPDGYGQGAYLGPSPRPPWIALHLAADT